MVAHHVDYGAVRTARIVQIGDAITYAGAQVQQGQCRLAGDPCIAVGHASHAAFKQTQNGAYLRQRAQCRQKMHL